jgi:hypothetical protein
MAAIDILIDQIVKSPGTPLVRTVATLPVAWSLPGTEDHQWDWYDSLHGTLAGLEVIEHREVSPALCRAVFQTQGQRPAR